MATKGFLPWGYLVLSCLVKGLVACSPSQPPTANSASVGRTVGTAPTNASLSEPALSEADRTWLQILKEADPPGLPKEWENREIVSADAAAFLTRMADAAVAAADHARSFPVKYPDHPRATEAKLREYRQLSVAAYFGRKAFSSRLEELAFEMAKNDRLQETMKFLARSAVADRLNYLGQLKTGLVKTSAFESELRTLQKEFPRLDETFDLLLDLAKAHLNDDAVDRAAAIAREISGSVASDAFKEAAASLLKLVERIGKPLTLQYTASDGRSVNLDGLRGKVVLIDGWATTCAICMAELPHLKALHSKLQPRGFEVVGINFDDAKEPFAKLLQRERLPWPNYFDGKGWENKFGAEYEITSLPMLWLVDKKGILRDVNALRDLDRKIESLLGE